jgi:hypothetical protein
MRGIQVVIDALRAESYPMELEEVNYNVGDIEVEDGHGGWVPVRQLTERFIRNRFYSAEEVVREIRQCLKQDKAA